jgi:hypothetical protein
MNAHVRPYLLAGGGIGNIKVRFRETDLGEMPQEILNEI